MLRLLKMLFIEYGSGVSLFAKKVKKMTPNQGGMYLPRVLIGRTVGIVVLPEESRELKKIEKTRDELLKIPIKKKEEIRESEGIETTVEKDKDRFNVDLNSKK